jgi:hypothetical protein
VWRIAVSLLCYVASPYAQASFVRIIHDRLVGVGITPTSTWALEASGREDFSRYTPEALRAAWSKNLDDILRSDALLLYDPTGEGRATYGEGELAIEWCKHVVWLSPRGIAQYAPDVIRPEGLDDAIDALARLARSAS